MSKMIFNVMDTETSGRSWKENEIIEVGIVKFDGTKEIDRYSQLIKPRKALDPKAMAVNKINPNDLMDKPYIEEVLSSITQFCGDETIIGHYFKNFDVLFLNKAFKEYAQKAPTGKIFCSLDLSRTTLGKKVDNHKLLTLIQYYQIPVDENELHRASTDCFYNGLVVNKLFKDLGISSFQELEKYQEPDLFSQPESQLVLF